MRASIIPVIALLAFSLGHAGEVYRWVDDDGTVHFSEDPPTDADQDAESRQVDADDVNSAESVDVEAIRSRLENSTEDDKPNVVMYWARSCPDCDRARDYFESNNIPVEERYAEKSDRGKLPVIFVGGEYMFGFSQDRFERLYDP